MLEFITSNYQLGKHLDVMKLLALQTSANKDLVKNTALPDIVKIRNEAVAAGIRQQFVAETTDRAFNGLSDFVDKLSRK